MTAMPLPFRPNCQPTSLGPLPHDNAAAAWEAVLRHTPGLPAMPLLSGSEEWPLLIGSEGFPGMARSNGQVVVDRAAATRALDRLYAMYLRGAGSTQAVELAALPRPPSGDQSPYRRARALFGLVPGPLSLALALVDEQGEPLASDAELVDAIGKHLFLRRLWLQRALERSGRPAIVWVYEPYWTSFAAPFSQQPPIEWWGAETQALGNGQIRALWMADIEMLATLPEAVSLDLVGTPLPDPERVSAVAPVVAQLLAQRTAIGWGIVPVTSEGIARASIGRMAARFESWLHALESSGIRLADVLGASLIMPEDTLAYLEPAEAERALALTAELASVIRHSYGVD
jgi:hypothetical protein